MVESNLIICFYFGIIIIIIVFDSLVVCCDYSILYGPVRINIDRSITCLICFSIKWVQTQLKNHSDELWENGVRDYLSHASDIMVM